MDPAPPTLRDTPLANAAPEPGRVRRRALIAAIVLLVLGGAGFIAYHPLLDAWIERQAEIHGFSLDFDRAELTLTAVRLRGARVTLLGVRGIRVTFDDVWVRLDGLTPTSVDAGGVLVSVEGSASDRLLELSAWSTKHPEFYRLPGSGVDIALAWSQRAGDAPWLTLAGGTLLSRGSGANFSAQMATIEGVPVGAIGAAWSTETEVISMGLGKETIAEAPIHVDLHPTSRPPTAEVAIRPFKLEALGAPLGVGLPAPGAVVEGSASLAFGPRLERDAIDGAVTMSIKGWIPPHPRQLDGIIFGNSTAFASKIRVSEDRRKVDLSEATVTAGAFKLKGKGTVDRDAEHAVARMDLAGSIPCADVARSATASDWGDAIGQLVGGLAQAAMQGSVAITVHVEADTKDLRAAKLKHEVGVGCGLRLPKIF